MIFFYIILLPIIYPTVKVILAIITTKYGKISYKDFNAFGFSYSDDKDIFYSTKNAWQKNFGYSHDYDVLAPFGSMIFDTEPIRFYYDNKNWLITFWKGQYGITTGAEIGAYYTNDKIINKHTLYMPVKDEDMLDMSLSLYKKKQYITTISAKHWWLAVFKLGMFSKPKDLIMDATITFKNEEQLNAFLNSFKKLKHKKKNYTIVDKTFIFHYKKPKTKKVWTRCFLIEAIVEHNNKRNVKLYNKFLNDSIDNYSLSKKKILVDDFVPPILKNEVIKNDNSKNVLILNDEVYPNNTYE